MLPSLNLKKSTTFAMRKPAAEGTQSPYPGGSNPTQSKQKAAKAQFWDRGGLKTEREARAMPNADLPFIEMESRNQPVIRKPSFPAEAFQGVEK